MLRPRYWIPLTLAATLPLSCERQEPKPSPAPEETSATFPQDTATPRTADTSHLGFAASVPADADLYLSGSFMDELVKAAGSLLLEQREITIPEGEHPPEVSDAFPPSQEELERIIKYTGDEVFLCIGPDMGEQIRIAGETYRTLSAAWGGFAVGLILDAINDKEVPGDFSQLLDSLPDDLLEKWLDTLEQDARLRIPSVMFGWHPDASKLQESHDFIQEGFAAIPQEGGMATPVSFESSGTRMNGFEIKGDALFREIIDQAETEMKKQGFEEQLPPQITEERISSLIKSLEDFRFIIASGIHDGHIIIYVGNGPEGFRLAKSPGQSLAASKALQWTNRFSKKNTLGFAYLSDSVVNSFLPWMDGSAWWKSLADTVRPPIQNPDTLRKLLTGLSTCSHELAKRDPSAWSALLVQDEGWLLETRGGWPDPDLDYHTPLTMLEATNTESSAIRGNWILNRERHDLSWKRTEYLATLMEAIVDEFRHASPETAAIAPETVTDRAIEEISELYRAYQNEFRMGLGVEVAFVADMEGEVPPVPGLSNETVESFRAPRFTYARNIANRELLDTAGSSFGESWKRLTTWGSELSGENLPLITPQSVESNGLTTWFAPLPFIGGDFLPGVTMNDELWMLGTSRSMTQDFATAMKTPASRQQTGMRLEIDFQPILEWGRELAGLAEEQAGAVTEEIPDELKSLATDGNKQLLDDTANSLQGLSIRKWMDGDTPGTTIHLRFHPTAD